MRSSSSSVAIGLAFGTLLLSTAMVSMPNAVQAGDAGEFSTIMLRGGIPHPSGYPWMRLLGFPARALEFTGFPAATAAAIPCALLACVGLALLAGATVAMSTPLIATTLVSIIACSPIVVRHAYDAEVWGPHIFFSALTLHFALTRRPPLVLGLALGAAVANHLTAVLLVPVAIGAAWPRPFTWPSLLRAAALGLVGSSVLIVIFGTLSVGDGGAWRWGDTQSWSGWVHHITRGDFGSFQLSIQKHGTPPVSIRISRALTSIGDAWTIGVIRHPWVVAVLLLAVLGIARRPSAFSRPLYVGWIGTLFLTTIVFPSAQNIDPSGSVGRWINERFDLLPILVWAPFFAAVLHRASTHPTGHRLRVLAGPALALIVAAQAVRSWHERPRLLQSTQTYAEDMLRGPGTASAVIFGTDDHRTFPALYVSALTPAEHPLYIDAALLYYPWYRDWLRQKRPELPIQDLPLKTIQAIVQTPALAETPIYVANIFSQPASQLPLVPEGILLRVVPPDRDPNFVAPEALTRRHLEASARITGTRRDFLGADDPQGDPFGAVLWDTYVQGARELARNLATVGRPDLASKVVEDALARGATEAELGTSVQAQPENDDANR